MADLLYRVSPEADPVLQVSPEQFKDMREAEAESTTYCSCSYGSHICFDEVKWETSLRRILGWGHLVDDLKAASLRGENIRVEVVWALGKNK